MTYVYGVSVGMDLSYTVYKRYSDAYNYARKLNRRARGTSYGDAYVVKVRLV